jgi:hypothetical protein
MGKKYEWKEVGLRELEVDEKISCQLSVEHFHYSTFKNPCRVEFNPFA